MKTTHQLAKELLSGPDVPVEVEEWADEDPIVQYFPDGTAMLVSCIFEESPKTPLRSLILGNKSATIDKRLTDYVQKNWDS